MPIIGGFIRENRERSGRNRDKEIAGSRLGVALRFAQSLDKLQPVEPARSVAGDEEIGLERGDRGDGRIDFETG